MKRAIILAAGMGTRLVRGYDFPKPLKHVAGVPLIIRIMRNLERAGVENVAVVVGYHGDILSDALRAHKFMFDLSIVWNREYEKPNGTSLLKAKDFVKEPTYVLMSDHLWAPELLQAVGKMPLACDEAILGVDERIDRCFDLDDATKVCLDGDRIVAIGKELSYYDAIDTGVFRVNRTLFDALEEVNGPQGCSLSQGVSALAALGKMRAVSVGGASWIDVDTPEAHRLAERLIARYGDTLSIPQELNASSFALGA